MKKERVSKCSLTRLQGMIKAYAFCVADHVVFERGVGVGERPAVAGRKASSRGGDSCQRVFKIVLC